MISTGLSGFSARLVLRSANCIPSPVRLVNCNHHVPFWTVYIRCEQCCMVSYSELSAAWLCFVPEVSHSPVANPAGTLPRRLSQLLNQREGVW
jgi:hypothetical protein